MSLTRYEQCILRRTEQDLTISAPRLTAELAAFAVTGDGQPRPAWEQIRGRETRLRAMLSQLLRLAAWSGHVLLGAGMACADEYGTFAPIQPGPGENDQSR